MKTIGKSKSYFERRWPYPYADKDSVKTHSPSKGFFDQCKEKTSAPGSSIV